MNKIIEKRIICIFQGPGKPNKTNCVTVDTSDLFIVPRLWRKDREIMTGHFVAETFEPFLRTRSLINAGKCIEYSKTSLELILPYSE